MKASALILCIFTLPTFAQSDYYANRYSGRATQIVPSNQSNFNTVNVYYYSTTTKNYYKGKNINRDAGAQPSPHGRLSYTFDRNQYAPTNLSINR